MTTDTPAAAPTAERETYEDRPDQDQILAVATSIGFKYDGFGGWKCELDTGELLARFRAALSAPVAAQPAASGVDAAESWINERCQYEVCDEEEKHDPKCKAWAVSGVDALWVRKAKKLADDVEQRAVSFGGSSDSYAEEADRKLAAAREALRTHLSTALTGAAKDVK